MKKIPLSGKNGKGLFAIVDDENFAFLSQFSWSLSLKGYAQAYIPVKWKNKYPVGKSIQMQRMVLFDSLDSKTYADHINRDKLDNRRKNLRVCTLAESNRNRGIIHFKHRQKIVSKFKGVWWDKTKWRCAITHNNKKIYLGRYDSELEAAKAYNEAADILFKEYAYLNPV